MWNYSITRSHTPSPFPLFVQNHFLTLNNFITMPLQIWALPHCTIPSLSKIEGTRTPPMSRSTTHPMSRSTIHPTHIEGQTWQTREENGFALLPTTKGCEMGSWRCEGRGMSGWSEERKGWGFSINNKNMIPLLNNV